MLKNDAIGLFATFLADWQNIFDDVTTSILLAIILFTMGQRCLFGNVYPSPQHHSSNHMHN